MKKSIHVLKNISAVCIFFIAMVSSTQTHAKTGIGIMGGDPSGITLKFNNFPVIGFGYDFGLTGGDAGSIDLNIDYWVVNNRISGPFYWYFGLGVSGTFHQDAWGVGLRLPIGLQWFPTGKIEVFLEGAPGLLVFPATTFSIGAALGIRFYIF